MLCRESADRFGNHPRLFDLKKMGGARNLQAFDPRQPLQQHGVALAEERLALLADERERRRLDARRVGFGEEAFFDRWQFRAEESVRVARRLIARAGADTLVDR